MKNSSMRKITVTAVMAALATALMFLEVSVPLMPEFIKLDFSDLPALITSFAFGPAWGVAVCLVKNLVKLLNTYTAGIGELANFILSAVFVAVAGLVYKNKHNKKFALIGALIGALAMAAISFPSNYFVVYPIYENLMSKEAILGAYKLIYPKTQSLAQALLIFNVPFTFIKGMLNSAITFVIYKKISPILKGKSI